MGVCFHMAHFWGTWGVGALFSLGLGEKEKYFLFRGIFMRVSRGTQKFPVNGSLSLHSGPVGEPGGGPLGGTF